MHMTFFQMELTDLQVNDKDKGICCKHVQQSLAPYNTPVNKLLGNYEIHVQDKTYR